MKLYSRRAALGISAIFLASSAMAAPEEGGSFFDGLYKEVNGFTGYANSTVGEGTESPTLIQFGAGITGGYWLGDSLFAGVSSDFRFINQYSDLDATVGNRRGTRWNIASPTIGYRLGEITLKADFQFLGAYSLTNETAGGQDVTFSSPIGGRIVGMMPVMNKLNLGVMFEYITFGKQTMDVVESELTTKLTLWQAGITAAYLF